MNYFPMFMSIKDREVLVCGGGRYAVEKIRKLKPFYPEFHVISENISSEIRIIAEIHTERRKFTREDLHSHPVFVIAAESGEENERIALLCHEQHIPVNIADQPEDCDLLISSIIIGHLCVGSISPAGAICLKNNFTETVPGDIDEIILWVKSLKEKLTCKRVETDTRNKILKLAMDEALSKERILTEQEIDEICRIA